MVPISAGVLAMATPTSRSSSTFSEAFAEGLDDGAGMAHLAALGRGEARDIGDDGLGHVVADVFRGLGFLRSADLADHHDGIRVRIGLEELENVLEGGAVDRIAADAHAGRDANPKSIIWAAAS